MSPLGIKRTIAILLILSPWIFIPGIFKDVVFIVSGVFLLISTLDLKKKSNLNPVNHENESTPNEHHAQRNQNEDIEESKSSIVVNA